MKITCAWVVDTTDPERIPWLLATYDENTEDSWGGVPDYYKDSLKEHSGPEYLIREMEIDIPDSRVEDMFKKVWVQGLAKPKATE